MQKAFRDIEEPVTLRTFNYLCHVNLGLVNSIIFLPEDTCIQLYALIQHHNQH